MGVIVVPRHGVKSAIWHLRGAIPFPLPLTFTPSSVILVFRVLPMLHGHNAKQIQMYVTSIKQPAKLLFLLYKYSRPVYPEVE
jgi:hypothetical protein